MKYLLVILLLCCTLATQAYDNDSRDTAGNNLFKGGPHRTINDLALIRWSDSRTDPLLKRYQLTTDTELQGPTIIDSGLEQVTTADRAGTFRWWLDEGGFTADEPELYNSFRHFYDPKSLGGVSYLTDHLDELNYVYRALIFTSKLGHAVGAIAGTDVNPRVNARDWAISGEANNGFGANQYCWNKGIAYMKAAFVETNGKQKQRLFAQAWRSLGETMHLIGDMSCVPHVRNDSHPGKAIGCTYFGNNDPNQGYLKNDPYELLCNETLVRASAGGSVDPAAKDLIDGAKTLPEIFDAVATYTQEHFFSADTIAGTYVKNPGTPTQQEVTVTSANGRHAYPFPVLRSCTFDKATGYLVKTVNGRPVRMCHELWMSSIGWGDPAKQGPQVTVDCVKDQAAILVPVAIYANARLLDLFMPRVDVQITGVDAQANTLAGTITHQPGGFYPDKLVYTQGQGQRFKVWVNGTELDPERYLLEIKGAGEITGELNTITLKEKDRVVIGVDVGGILIKSPEYTVVKTNDNLAKLHAYNNINVSLVIPEDTMTIEGSTFYTEKRSDIYTIWNVLENGGDVLAHVPLVWNGTSFAAEGTLKASNNDISFLEIKIKGQVDATGTKILNVTCTENAKFTIRDEAWNQDYFSQKSFGLVNIPLWVHPSLKGKAVKEHVTGLAWRYRLPTSGGHTYKFVEVNWDKTEAANIEITFSRTRNRRIEY